LGSCGSSADVGDVIVKRMDDLGFNEVGKLIYVVLDG
jgi:hypothetical protein